MCTWLPPPPPSCLAVFRQCLHKKRSVAAAAAEEEDGARGRGGRGSDKAADCRESGHVSQLAPNKENTPQRGASRNRAPRSARSPRGVTPPSQRHLFAGRYCELCGGLISRRLEAGQLAHKHGTGRCSALDSAPSPPRRGSPALRPPTFGCAARLFV